MNDISNIDYPPLELIIKKEQEPLKQGLSQHFLTTLASIINDAYDTPKNKKDNFICKEKTKIELLKLFQSSKMFKDSERIYDNVKYLAVIEGETDEIGKIVSLNIQDKTVEYFTYRDQQNKTVARKAKWSEVALFDYNSPQLEAMVRRYKRTNQSNLSIADIYAFLSVKDHVVVKEKADFGRIIVNSAEAPVMKRIMANYDIPIEAVAPPKRTLHCLNADTLEVVHIFESVKEAALALNISASTISNVLCLGFSAHNYREAGTKDAKYKWQYSDEKNHKYFEDFDPAIYYPVDYNFDIFLKNLGKEGAARFMALPYSEKIKEYTDEIPVKKQDAVIKKDK